MAYLVSRKGVQLTSSPLESLDAQNQKIINVLNPTNAQDVATKDYVDGQNSAGALDGTFRIKNTADETKQLAFDVSGVAVSTTRTVIMPNSNVDLGLIATAIQSSEKAAANGVATLDAGGKLLTSQLPPLAITSTFVVANEVAQLALTVQEGDVAVRSDENKSYIALNATNGSMGDWQVLLTPTDAVLSVNGQTGVVVLSTTDIAEGSNLYYTQARFDSAFTAKSTSDLSEGSNLYFTDARAKSAAVDDTVYGVGWDAVLDIAPSKNAVYDKIESLSTTDISEGSNLYFTDARAKSAAVVNSTAGSETDQAASVAAMKSYVAGEIATKDQASEISFNNATSGLTATDVQGAIDEVEGRLDTAETNIGTNSTDIGTNSGDIATLQGDSGLVFEDGLIGEAVAGINQLYFVRKSNQAEFDGRFYLAQADTIKNSRIVGYIIVGGTALSAGDSVRIFKAGKAILGSADTVFGAPNQGDMVYLSQTVPGKWSLVPTTTSGDIIKELGYAGGAPGELEYIPSTMVLEA